MRTILFAGMTVVALGVMVPLGLCQESFKAPGGAEVRESISRADSTLSSRIRELELRVKELEEQEPGAPGRKRQRARMGGKENESELEMLLKEAQSLDHVAPDEAPPLVFHGSERHQPQLNPEISMTGDFFGSCSSSDNSRITDTGNFTDGRNRFYLRGAELNVVAPLDPFTRGKFFLCIPGIGDVSLSEMIDEAYMEWLNLPARLNIKIGKFNTQFGILNRWHDHGLPQVDRPSALNNLFLGESLSGLGMSGNFLLGSLWADANELTVDVVTGGDGQSFDTSYDTVIGVAHLKNFYDLTRNTYLELGFSGANGYNDPGHKYFTTLGGVDMTLKWVPAERSHYRTIEFRNEFFISHREESAKDLNRYGFYSSLKNKHGPHFWYGLRYSYSQLPIPVSAPSARDYEWDITPTIDYWQSEFVMIRLQYSYTKRNYLENDHSFFLQSVWSMGPHKHEAY